MVVRYSEDWRWSGTPATLEGLTAAAYEELRDIPELQAQTFAEFDHRARGMLSEETRIEIFAWDDVTGELLGGIIGAVIDDIHYGPCFSARIQYVHPDARKLGVYRELFKRFLAAGKTLGLPLYHTTHRQKPGEYIHKYRRIK